MGKKYLQLVEITETNAEKENGDQVSECKEIGGKQGNMKKERITEGRKR